MRFCTLCMRSPLKSDFGNYGSMAHNFVNNQSFQNLEVVLYRAQTKNQIDVYIEF